MPTFVHLASQPQSSEIAAAKSVQHEIGAGLHSQYPLLSDYANLTQVQLRAGALGDERNCFIAEGEGVVRRLIASSYRVRSVLITEHHAESRMADSLAMLPPHVPVYVVTQALMESLSGFDFHRGVLASAEIGIEPSLTSLLDSCDLLVVCEGLTNIENIGAVFRNIACLSWGNAGVVRDSASCHPFYRKSLRVSMGNALMVPFVTVPEITSTLAAVKQAGFTTLAMTPAAHAVELCSATIRSMHKLHNKLRPAIVLGSEGPGLKSETIAACDHAVRIRMAPGTDSLNVATSLAVTLHALSQT